MSTEHKPGTTVWLNPATVQAELLKPYLNQPGSLLAILPLTYTAKVGGGQEARIKEQSALTMVRVLFGNTIFFCPLSYLLPPHTKPPKT